MKQQKEIIPDPIQTIRDPQDGELKTTIPNPHEIKAEAPTKKAEVANGKE